MNPTVNYLEKVREFRQRSRNFLWFRAPRLNGVGNGPTKLVVVPTGWRSQAAFRMTSRLGNFIRSREMIKRKIASLVVYHVDCVEQKGSKPHWLLAI